MAGTRKKKMHRRKTRKTRKGGRAMPPRPNAPLNAPPPPELPPPENKRNINYYNRLLKNLKERISKKGINHLSPNEQKWKEWFRTQTNPDLPSNKFEVNDPDASYETRLNINKQSPPPQNNNQKSPPQNNNQKPPPQNNNQKPPPQNKNQPPPQNNNQKPPPQNKNQPPPQPILGTSV